MNDYKHSGKLVFAWKTRQSSIHMPEILRNFDHKDFNKDKIESYD